MFEEILAKLGKSLRDHRVPYMIIGGPNDLPALIPSQPPISVASVLGHPSGRVVGRNLGTSLAAGNNPAKNPYPK